MDRNLEIALVSSALAVVCAYGLRQRLREGYTQFGWKRIDRREDPAGFWAFMLIAGLCEAAFVGMAVVYFVAWL